jgi:hypothetical protein
MSDKEFGGKYKGAPRTSPLPTSYVFCTPTARIRCYENETDDDKQATMTSRSLKVRKPTASPIDPAFPSRAPLDLELLRHG